MSATTLQSISDCEPLMGTLNRPLERIEQPASGCADGRTAGGHAKRGRRARETRPEVTRAASVSVWRHLLAQLVDELPHGLFPAVHFDGLDVLEHLRREGDALVDLPSALVSESERTRAAPRSIPVQMGPRWK